MSKRSQKRFRPYDPDAPLAMPVCLRNWLPDDHLAYLISDVVVTLDLSEIYAYYERVLRGQPAYDPRMMVTLIFYAYTVGIPASRRIEKKTYEDIAFRIVTANQHPDHDTICDFRKTNRDAVNALTHTVVHELGRLQDPAPGDLAARVRAFVRSNLDRRITHDDLATAAGLTKYHFARRFKQVTRQTPMRLVNQIRVDVAESLLAHQAVELGMPWAVS